jgi:hypothetical protein
MRLHTCPSARLAVSSKSTPCSHLQGGSRRRDKPAPWERSDTSGPRARQRHLEDLPCRGVFHCVLDRDAPPLLDGLDPVEIRRVDAHRPVKLLVLLPLTCARDTCTGSGSGSRGRELGLRRVGECGCGCGRLRARGFVRLYAERRQVAEDDGAPVTSSMTGSEFRTAAMRAAVV